MKMIYLRNPRNKRRGSNAVAIVSVVVLTVIVFNFAAPRFLSSLFLQAGAPLWRVRSTVVAGFSTIAAYFSSKSSLQKERDRLRGLTEDLSVELRRREAIIAEHEKLLRELGRDDEESFIHAYVLRKPGTSPFDVIIVDAGLQEGVSRSALVFAGGSVIGDVKETQGHISTVELFSSPGRETEVVVGGVNIHATAIGRGGGNFEIRLPRDANINRGTLLELPGKNGPLAEVEEIEIDEASAQQLLIARSLVNIQMRSWLLIRRSHPNI